MDLVRHLRFFVAVAEEGHFGDAAARLEMTQPPVSQGLRRLEKELGVQLIRRTSRGAELTDAGRDLLPRARLLIDDAARFLGEARRLHDGSEVLRWGAVPLAGTAAVAAVAQRLGDVSSGQEMVSATTVGLVEQVSAGALDLAIVDAPCVTGTLTAGPVVVFRRQVVVPAGHPVTTASRPRLRQLAGLDLCHPPRAANPPAHDQLIDRLREAGLDPHVLPVSSVEHLVAAVAGGGAFGLTSDAERLASLDAVRCLPLGRDTTALRLRVVYREPALAEVADVTTAALWKISKASG
ncbi:LysR family transcriptional regulator [Gordonia rubripertincta]|uniref:LysR family transcriptional regulator n=1 Tax=Gordonia rubripertincta TaxID=36822 RepID=UPI000B8D8BFF|nr:LysR family transcriptional regulator [Gordonia rubripertincta]ASR01113.1 HTH-type transcriptional regulator BenM [Gordonia rubripertincta]